MKIIYIYIILVFFIIFNSCDILRLSPFEVSHWSPGSIAPGEDSYYTDPANIIVSVKFSHDPDRSSVEKYFSLTEDGNQVKGTFEWDGKKVVFHPFVSLEKNRDYILGISAEAHNTEGLNMDRAFEGRFSTRPDNNRPVLLSHYPGSAETLSGSRSEIHLFFSIPVSLNSLYSNISFTPSMNGSWTLADNGKTTIFTPVESWILNTCYEMRISASLEATNGMAFGKNIDNVFFTGIDQNKPTLESAFRLTDKDEEILLDAGTSAILAPDGTIIENQNWEKNNRLKLTFSKPVDSLSVKNCLSVDGGPELVLETRPGYHTEFIFSFISNLVFESRFNIRLRAGVKDNAGNESDSDYFFRVYANGIKSRPPELVGIRFPLAPGSLIDKEPVSYGIDSLFLHLPINEGAENYPSNTGTGTFIEFYFNTTPGASIDPFSLMETFRIDTSNNVLVFSPRLVISGDKVNPGSFSISKPDPDWEIFERLEIRGILTNSANFGVVNFLIAPGLKDSYGNKNDKQFSIPLLK